MPKEPDFETASPVDQRDLPTLQETLQANPADGPRPLTIDEYRARNTKNEKRCNRNHKRSGTKVKLLQQRRLVKDMIQSAKDEPARQRYIERF